MTSPREEHARSIRRMFGGVARRYDFLNHLLSLNIDRSWRRRTARRVRPILARPGARALDLCCGTGDLLAALTAEGVTVWGCDFCHPMLVIARRKSPDCTVFEADALRLPLPDACVDLVTVAFGVRNLTSREAGYAEMLRVLRPGGAAAILEFSQPPNRMMALLYAGYSRLLPRIGAAVSDAGDAYAYLPESVRRFPPAEELAVEMQRAGFREVSFQHMTAGVVALHLGTR